MRREEELKWKDKKENRRCEEGKQQMKGKQQETQGSERMRGDNELRENRRGREGEGGNEERKWKGKQRGRRGSDITGEGRGYTSSTREEARGKEMR